MKKVSICTCTYNRNRYLDLLEETILGQDYPHQLIEWIVVDDSDINDTEHQFKKHDFLNIKYKRLYKRASIGKKRNISNKMASGEIIIYMDDDDYYPNTRVSHSVDKLVNSRCLIAGCNTIPIYFLDNGELWSTTIPYQWHSTASVIAFKRELLEITSFNNSDWEGEEKYFLKNYTIELEQLDPSKTIISIAHNSNTISKEPIRLLPKLFSAQNILLNKNKKEKLEFIFQKYNKINNISDSNKKLLERKRNLILKPKASNWKSINNLELCVITLPVNNQRIRDLKKHFNNLGLAPTFFEGIAPKNLRKYINNGQIISTNRKEVLCCLSSHLLSLNYMLKNSTKEFFLIMEDDVRLFPYPKNLKEVFLLSAHWDIVQLGSCNLSAQIELDVLYDTAQIISRWTINNYGTHAYLINRKYAKKLLKKYLSDKNSINLSNAHGYLLADRLLYQSGDALTMNFPIAMQCHKYESFIGYEKSDEKIRIYLENYLASKWLSEAQYYYF